MTVCVPVNDASAASVYAEMVDATLEVRHIGPWARDLAGQILVPVPLKVAGQLLADVLGSIGLQTQNQSQPQVTSCELLC